MLNLVTGATGLVGNNVVRMLIERGERVRALVRNPGDKSLAGLPIDLVQGDVCDAAAIRRAADGVDRIIHAAARVHLGWTGLELHRSVNVEGTRIVARAAKNAGVPHGPRFQRGCSGAGQPRTARRRRMPAGRLGALSLCRDQTRGGAAVMEQVVAGARRA